MTRNGLLNNSNFIGYLFILPWLSGFMFMYLIPIISSMYFSLTNYNLLYSPKFIGFANFYRMFFIDPNF